MAPFLRSYVARMNRELRWIKSRSNLCSPPPGSDPELTGARWTVAQFGSRIAGAFGGYGLGDMLIGDLASKLREKNEMVEEYVKDTREKMTKKRG